MNPSIPRGAAPIFGAPWTALVVAATVGCGVPAVPADSGGAEGDEASTADPATTLPSPTDLQHLGVCAIPER